MSGMGGTPLVYSHHRDHKGSFHSGKCKGEGRHFTAYVLKGVKCFKTEHLLLNSNSLVFMALSFSLLVIIKIYNLSMLVQL